MFPFHLILKIYYGKIYQILISFHHIEVLHLLRAVQIIIRPTDNNVMASIYTYDPQSYSWSVPNITEDNNRKAFITSINYNEKMYLFGGQFKPYDGKSNDIDMLIFNTVSLSWESGSSINAPLIRSDYGAVLLPNKNIIYLGKL